MERLGSNTGQEEQGHVRMGTPGPQFHMKPGTPVPNFIIFWGPFHENGDPHVIFFSLLLFAILM